MNNNLILENVVELLTNTLNMTSVFYDIFLNPNPMDVELEQYDDNNQLIKVIIPNRAKDRIISKIGEGSPEGSVEAPVGTMYIDELTSRIYIKVSGDDASGWLPLITKDDVIDIINDSDFVTVQYLIRNQYVTRNDKATPSEAGVVTYDNLSIAENDRAQLQAVGVMDQTNSVNRLWVGLKEEFDAITEKDENSIYIITDDSDEEYITSDDENPVAEVSEDENEPEGD